MSLVYQCASCEKRFKVADTSAGKRVRCTGCGAVGTVPGPRMGADPGSLPPRPVQASAAASSPPPPPPRRAATPPPPPPPRQPEAEEDPFAAMEQLEQSGTPHDEGDLALKPPPPPPPGSRGASAPSLPPMAPQRPAAINPVAAPWVPGYLSFLDFNKPMHRIALMAIFGLLVVIGIGAAGFFYMKAQKDSHFNNTAQVAEGRLTGRAERHDIRRRRRSSQEAYDIKYTYKVDGQSYTGEEDQVKVDEIPGDPTRSFDGQNIMVEVKYDPDHPEVNRLTDAPTGGDWFVVAIGGGACLAGLFGGWRVWRYDRYARSIGT